MYIFYKSGYYCNFYAKDTALNVGSRDETRCIKVDSDKFTLERERKSRNIIKII